MLTRIETNQVTLNGHAVQVIPFDFKVSAELDHLLNLFPRAKLDRYYKEYVINTGAEVSFFPYRWCMNVLQLGAFIEQAGDLEGAEEMIAELMHEAAPYIVEYDGAQYLGHPFSHEECGKSLRAPWYSGLSQGFLLAAWVQLLRATGEAKYRKNAVKTRLSFSRFRDREGQPAPWVTYVDENGYLWFEEYPAADDPQVHVLNGHIYGIMGLYSWYRLTPDDETRALIRAGCTTVNAYFGAYRRPGNVNAYCLVPDAEPDYKPSRSVDQQRWLFDLTGHNVFREQWLAFQADMS